MSMTRKPFLHLLHLLRQTRILCPVALNSFLLLFFKNTFFLLEELLQVLCWAPEHPQLCHHNHYRMNWKPRWPPGFFWHHQELYYNYYWIVVFHLCFFGCFLWLSQSLGMYRTPLLNADPFLWSVTLFCSVAVERFIVLWRSEGVFHARLAFC